MSRYEEGLADGRDYGKHEIEDGGMGVITDILISNPRYNNHDNSEDYKRGFEQGRKEGLRSASK